MKLLTLAGCRSGPFESLTRCNFPLALGKLKEKALHALFSLRKQTNPSKLPPFPANKIFDAVFDSGIFSILVHNSEVWVHMYNVILSLGTAPRSKK